MIITIDGPAGAGKSTLAKMLAARLGYDYLDTGSMYRTVALAGLRRNVNWDNPTELENVAKSIRLDIDNGRTLLDGEDVTDAVRSQEVTGHIRFAANNPDIRLLMVNQQRAIAERLAKAGKSLVTEGRDQGSIVFPDAECKIYLTATPEERTRRRLSEMRQRNESGDFDEILKSINKRDNEDVNRKIAPLIRPKNSIELITDGMNANEVLERLCEIVGKC
ncbi:MAG: (d)CMP kinase [Planctomycetaceae bacterium]|jgi:cytidylate kinase|nr:(d)CMP kinase [Planctomycetaceae bacterium]